MLKDKNNQLSIYSNIITIKFQKIIYLKLINNAIDFSFINKTTRKVLL